MLKLNVVRKSLIAAVVVLIAVLSFPPVTR